MIFSVAFVLHLIVELSLARPKNVLLIMSDDMRPDIGVYKPDVHVVTPNLDHLASRSVVVKRAYVQQAVCSPSRTSMLTGRRPDTTHVHDLTQYFRKVAGNFVTMPEYFKMHGYATAGIGKIFHPGRASGHDDPPSWTEPYFHPDQKYWNNRTDASWLAAEDSEVSKYPLPDMQIVSAAVSSLKKFSLSNRQFFLAVGFLKPHLPFIFPKHFLDLYPETSVKLPSNPFAPDHMPEIAWSNFDEIRKYADIGIKYGYGSINSSFPDSVILSLRRAYYASISYVDSLIGQIVNTLTDLGLASNTVVVFVGDHGWQLGEHGEWCKHTNFELATHAPMILSIPGLTDQGSFTDELIEFVDLFPTVADVTGLPVPPLCPENSSHVAVCVEGFSMLPLIHSNTITNSSWKRAAFSQYPRMLVDGDVRMGYSIRTDRFRYTEWTLYDAVEYRPVWSASHMSSELYDHVVDPDENQNVVHRTQYVDVRKLLSKMLRAGWRAAIEEKGNVTPA